MRTITVAIAILAGALAAGAFGAEVKIDQTKLKDIPEKLSPLLGHEISGAVTSVVTRDGVAEFEAVGKSNLEKGEAMKPDAMFWIASMTKPVTATAVLILQQEGKLSVYDPVAKYIPELAELKGPDGKPAKVTLKHLLTHTSGMVSEYTARNVPFN